MISDRELEELLVEAIPLMRLEELAAIDQILKEREPHVFSKEYEKKKDKLLKEYSRRKSTEPVIKEQKHGYRRVKLRYLLVAILILILSATTVLAFEPFREIMESIMYTVFPDHVEIEGTEENSVAADVTELKRPSYIPEGYELVSEISEDMCHLIWENKDKKKFSYTQYSHYDGNLIISSDGTKPENVNIGDIEGKMVVDEHGTCTIFYEDGAWVYAVVSRSLDKAELIKILESLE